MIEDGLGFQLVPWQPVLEKWIGQHITGVWRSDGVIEWGLGRKRGLALIWRDICGTAPSGKCFLQTFHPAGKVRSYVRPFSAVIDRWP